jgi:hypothetical protein
MNSGIFIILQTPNFEFSGCEMTATPFRKKKKKERHMGKVKRHKT